MANATTTRRDMLRLGTSAAAYAAGAAIVTGGVAIASEAKGAVGVSPELLRLIADAKQKNAASLDHDENVLSPAHARRVRAVEAAQASLVHVTADAGESMMGGRIVWATTDSVDVAMAKSAVRMAREGKLNLDDGGEYVRAARKITAASLRHGRAIARARRAHDTTAEDERSIALCCASADADQVVAGFTPRSLADLQAKLAFMVENDMGNGMDWLPELLSDVTTLSKKEG